MTGAMFKSEEVVRGRTNIRFSSLFRRGTVYSVENIMAYSMFPSPYTPLYSHLRYDVLRNGEFIGQEGDFLAALRLVAEDFAYKLWRGPLGSICRDDDKLEELVWWFVRWIPEDKGGCEAGTVSNACRPTKTPERKPELPRSGSSVEKPRKPVTSADIENEMAKNIASLYRVGITEDEADELIRRLSALSGMTANLNDVSTASVVTQKRIT
jgi:hypothetical protein